MVWAVMSFIALVEEFSGKALPAARTACSDDLPWRSAHQPPKQDDYQELGPNGLKEFEVCSRSPAEGRPGIRWDALPLRTDLHVQREADVVRKDQRQTE